MVFPVSCYRVIRVDARVPFDKGRLVAQRRAPKVLAGHLIGFEGSMPPSGGIPLQIVPAGLRNILGYIGSTARASAM
jgi:hypothetical protein